MSAVTGHAATSVPAARQPLMAGAAPAATPARLLTTACGLADQIVACGMSSSGGPARVNWLGLQPVESTPWVVLPMGAGLADGYLGVALFLAQLARLSEVSRYAEVARRAVGPLPALLSVLDDRPDLLATVGSGAAEGLAGISYALARMSTLLDDPALGEWADNAAQLTTRVVVPSAEAPAGWLDGLAGCLAAMTAVHTELGSAAAAAAARECADQLAALVKRTAGRCAAPVQPVPLGFAAGPAGVGWALARFGVSVGDLAHQEAGRRAVWCAVGRVADGGGDDSPGWCRGAAGLLVAESCLGDTGLLREAQLLTQRPVLRDLSLCHGEAGITEALTMLTSTAAARTAQPSPEQPSPEQPGGGPASAPPPWRQRAGLIVSTVGQHTRFCGTPGGVPTPGLLRGLAGIGYGLLRAGFTERVPSVLFLEPTPAADEPG